MSRHDDESFWLEQMLAGTFTTKHSAEASQTVYHAKFFGLPCQAPLTSLMIEGSVGEDHAGGWVTLLHSEPFPNQRLGIPRAGV